MRLKILVMVVAAIAVAAIYLLFVHRGSSNSGEHDPDQNRDACGDADLTKGATAEACRQHALDLIGRQRTVNVDAGRALLKKLCDQVYEQACIDLNEFASLELRLAEGRCDADWFKPGDAGACAILANAFETGQGRPQDPEQARKWYAKACELHLESACAKK